MERTLTPRQRLTRNFGIALLRGADVLFHAVEHVAFIVAVWLFDWLRGRLLRPPMSVLTELAEFAFGIGFIYNLLMTALFHRRSPRRTKKRR